jgi:hypothetical protein
MQNNINSKPDKENKLTNEINWHLVTAKTIDLTSSEKELNNFNCVVDTSLEKKECSFRSELIIYLILHIK